MESENQSNPYEENLNDGYEQIKNIYQLQLERLKTSDEKLNMLLVFNAAILALLIIVFPFSTESITRIILVVVFSVFVISMLLTVISIFVGLFPKKLEIIDIKNYIRADQYNCTRKEYIGKYISGYESAINSIIGAVEKKQTMIKHSMIETIINIVLIVALIVIKII